MNTTKSTQEIWDTYLETFEHGKTGSKTFRLDLIEKAPFAKYPHLLIVGTKYQTTQKDGFPEGKDFDLLFTIGDQINELLEDATNVLMVGSFLYNNERLEYFYLEQEEGIVPILENFYQQQHPDRKFFITIKEDKSWKYYKEFLFPKKDLLKELEKNAASCI